MSYSAIVEGLHVRFRTVSGIRAILAYEPTAIHDTPTMYSLLDRIEPMHKGQMKFTRYRILHRLCFKWQDNEQAELELMPYVDSIPAAVKGDPRLDGAITSGLAVIEEVVGVFVRIGGTTYRALDFYSDVIVKE